MTHNFVNMKQPINETVPKTTGSSVQRNIKENIIVQSQRVTPVLPVPPPPSSTEEEVEEFLQDRRLYSEITRLNQPSTSGMDRDSRISRNYVKDSEGFIRREKKPRSSQGTLAMGRKSGTTIKVTPISRNVEFSSVALHLTFQ